ncbi:hypothetical protein EG329_004999 [Mollisiaceae sp. DMI_Dod_QoI]|nr:hypothetical protein EG329_004999 [Helotiales sp. DMI_Dod_QoI]
MNYTGTCAKGRYIEDRRRTLKSSHCHDEMIFIGLFLLGVIPSGGIDIIITPYVLDSITTIQPIPFLELGASLSTLPFVRIVKGHDGRAVSSKAACTFTDYRIDLRHFSCRLRLLAYTHRVAILLALRALNIFFGTTGLQASNASCSWTRLGSMPSPTTQPLDLSHIDLHNPRPRSKQDGISHSTLAKFPASYSPLLLSSASMANHHCSSPCSCPDALTFSDRPFRVQDIRERVQACGNGFDPGNELQTSAYQHLLLFPFVSSSPVSFRNVPSLNWTGYH